MHLNHTTTPDTDNIAKAKLHKFAALGGTAPKRKFFEEPSWPYLNTKVKLSLQLL